MSRPLHSCRLSVPFALLLATLGVAWPIAVHAAATCFIGDCTTDATGLTTNTAILPFAGTVFDPVTAEDVSVSGQLHIVTQVRPSSDPATPSILQMALLSLPADVSAVGLTTGARYIAFGTFQSAPTPIVNDSVFLVADIRNGGGGWVHPFLVKGIQGVVTVQFGVSLMFSDGGALLPTSQVSVGLEEIY
jgi:hypothetical protein